ncbi:hypothetical protein HRbin12_01272 [bacterium HR12]|nr:hypothetical protein HRbin12_01272 [bacterium HR12]
MGANDFRAALAWLSIAAGLIHSANVREHLEEWWGYGVFFLLAAVVQIGYGIVFLVRPWRWDERGGVRTDAGAVGHADRRFVLIGIGLNAPLIALWAVTRTVGIPFLGPEAGEVEPITGVSVLTKLLEAGLIVSGVWYLRATRAPRPGATPP